MFKQLEDKFDSIFDEFIQEFNVEKEKIPISKELLIENAKSCIIYEIPIKKAIKKVVKQIKEDLEENNQEIDSENEISTGDLIGNLNGNFNGNLIGSLNDDFDDEQVNSFKEEISVLKRKISNRDKLIQDLKAKNKELTIENQDNNKKINKLQNEINFLNKKSSKEILKEK
ncbi:MAG: hypothetical protein LBR24_00470, partial [Methanobrevibacter sp.]|nr:hypothetical protein [Methanobrevibacter sp.]